MTDRSGEAYVFYSRIDHDGWTHRGVIAIGTFTMLTRYTCIRGGSIWEPANIDCRQ
jgi:hypothetical protein